MQLTASRPRTWLLLHFGRGSSLLVLEQATVTSTKNLEWPELDCGQKGWHFVTCGHISRQCDMWSRRPDCVTVSLTHGGGAGGGLLHEYID